MTFDGVVGPPSVAFAANGAVHVLVGHGDDASDTKAVLHVVSPDGTDVTSDELGRLDAARSAGEMHARVAVHEDGSTTVVLPSPDPAEAEEGADLRIVRVRADGTIAWTQPIPRSAMTNGADRIHVAAAPGLHARVALFTSELDVGFGQREGKLHILDVEADGTIAKHDAIEEPDSASAARHPYVGVGGARVVDFRVASAGESYLLLQDYPSGAGMKTVRVTESGTASIYVLGLSRDQPLALLDTTGGAFAAVGNFSLMQGAEPDDMSRAPLLDLPAGPKSVVVPFAPTPQVTVLPMADTSSTPIWRHATTSGDEVLLGGGLTTRVPSSTGDLSFAAAAFASTTRSVSWPATGGSIATATHVGADGALVVAGYFSGTMNVGAKVLQAPRVSSAPFLVVLRSVAAAADVTTPEITTCAVASEACAACIAENTPNIGSPCSDDGSCVHAALLGTACACAAEDEATDGYAACFDGLLSYGVYGEAVHETYVTTCAEACTMQ